MMVMIGFVIVIGCVFGTFAAIGGHMGILWQPGEIVIIGGAAVGAYIIANPKEVISKTPGAITDALNGSVFTKEDFIELLCMQFTIFKLAKTKGMLAVEQHVEAPEESNVFQNFPKFLGRHHPLVFFCDYMRMMTMGSENPYQMEDLMNIEIDIHHHERHVLVSAIQNMGDALPALGIVAAVLGIIKTMGAISQPPEVLGGLIGAALVGTFLGILLSYGLVGPLATLLGVLYESEVCYYNCIKSGILAYLNGYAPAIAIEFARKSIESDVRPSFYELEEAINNLSG